MKKQVFSSYFSIFFVFFLLFSAVLPTVASAQAESDPSSSGPPTTTCANYVLMDEATGEVLAEKEKDTRSNPASLTKMMTALLLLESGKDLEQTMVCPSTVTSFDSDSSLVGLYDGEELSYKDLLYGLMLVSGNDATAAIASDLGGGDISAFVEKMNQRAQELGMTNTHFANPHGLTNENHYTTAYDLALLARECMKNDTFRTVVSTPEYTMAATNRHDARTIYISNRFISTKESNQPYHYDAATGIKTGSTSAAGGCLAASAKVGDREIIAIVLGDHTSGQNQRWVDARALLDYGFTITVLDLTQKIKDTPLQTILPGDSEPSVLTPILPDGEIYYQATSDLANAFNAEGAQLTVSYELDPGLTAPVPDGATVGQAVYSLNGTELYRTQVTKKPVVVTETPVESDAFRPVIIILLCIGIFFLLVIILRILTKPRRKRQMRNSRRLYGSDSKRARQAARQTGRKNQRKQLRPPSEYERSRSARRPRR